MKHIPDEHRIYRHWGYNPYIDEAYIDVDNDDFENTGYAYRIDGGWRLTDKDHNSVDDPYIVRKVMEGLRGDEVVPESLNDFNFEKLHYGQPLPMEGY
jgi:hypothetical protein